MPRVRPPRARPRGPRRAVLAAVLVAAVGLPGAGCAATTALPVGPSGVDGLVVPSASPSPDDYVEGVDNPWLAWTPGSVRVLSGGTGSSWATLTTTVRPGTVPLGGLAATAVETRLVTAGDVVVAVDLYAQDLAGNVWWVGREGQWQAGVDGAEAGLVMPATPRVGDGFRTALVPGVVEERAEVLRAPLPGAGDDEVVTLELRSELDPGVQVRVYERGLGLVLDDRPGSAPLRVG